MKRFIALAAIWTAVIGLTLTQMFAGPERYSGKEVAPVVEPQCDWTGFYIGGHGGVRGGEVIWWDKTDNDNFGIGEAVLREHQDAFIGGGQIGYNRQINSWFVIGVELTGSYSGGANDTNTFNEPGDETKHYKTENTWSGTLALRMGVTAMNKKLFVFGKVGGALAQWNYEYINDESQSAGTTEIDRYHKDETRVGPMAGAGVEYMINCHWSAKVEWDHLFLGRQSNNGTLVEDFESDDSYNVDHQLGFDTVTVGINYKF